MWRSIRSKKYIMIYNQVLTYIKTNQSLSHLHRLPSTFHIAFSAACHSCSLAIVHVPSCCLQSFLLPIVPSAEDAHVTCLQSGFNLQGQAQNGISSRKPSWIHQLEALTISSPCHFRQFDESKGKMGTIFVLS